MPAPLLRVIEPPCWLVKMSLVKYMSIVPVLELMVVITLLERTITGFPWALAKDRPDADCTKEPPSK